MSVKNCPRCGKIFVGIATASICPACEKKEDEDFKKVKTYLSENRDATLDEVVNETEVSLKRITKFIREGRLEITRGLSGEFKCESCGKEITTGIYCEDCFGRIKSDLSDALRPASDNRKGQMHLRKRL